MSIQDSSASITTSIKRFFSGTLLSRVTGLAREVAMATVFGTTPAVAAFWMAFRFAYLLRRLFGEGALNAAFVPYFESLRKEDSQKGARFFFNLSSGLILLLLLITLVVEGVLGGLLLFADLEVGTKEVLTLTMSLLPALVFICLYALNTSLLNCEQSYFLPSAAPSLLNIVWVAAVLLLWGKVPAEAMRTMAIVITFAFVLQWGVTLPGVSKFLTRELGKQWWRGQGFAWREILLILRPFLLGMVGVAATQINSAFDAIFSRAADPSGPAYLWYAIRIQQLPLALFGLGVSGALLPPISRADKSQYIHFVSYGLKKTVTLMLPVTFGMFALGFSGINLVYGHGEFTTSAIHETTHCLWAYGLGLLPMTGVLLLASSFYARKNYTLPSILTMVCVTVNMGLNTFFVYGLHWGAVSIALATSLTSCLNVGLLAYFLQKEEKEIFRGIPTLILKITLCALFAAFITLSVNEFWFKNALPRGLLAQLGMFGKDTALFGGSLVFISYLFKVDEIYKLFSLRILRRG